MYLRMFHTVKKAWEKFYKRIVGLFRFVQDYRVILFSLVYIVMNSLSISLLRNIVICSTIRPVMISFLLLLLVLVIFFLLKFRWKFPRGKKSMKSGDIRSFKFCALLLLSLATMVFTLFRNMPIIRNEMETLKNIKSFTKGSTKFKAYIMDEIEEKHTGQQIVVQLLEGILSEEKFLDKTSSFLLLKLPSFYEFEIGQVCEVEGQLSEPENFEDFDYKKFLANKKIFFLIENPKIFCKEIIENRMGNIFKNALVDLKTKLIKNIDSVLNEPQSSLLAGILFGQKRLFSRQFEEATRVSGVSHIVAASGYNVTILSLAINKLLFFLPKRWKLIASLIVIWMFAILSGFSSSIVRACMMGSVSMVALLFGRSNSVHVALPFVAFLFVLFNPFAVSDIGFLLSISAVLGLVYILPILTAVKERITKKYTFLDDFVLPTLSCTLSTLPISIFTFKTFSIWSVPVNALILPVVESTMLFGFLALLFQQIFSPLSYILFSVVNVQLKYFESVVNFVQKLNFGQALLSDSASRTLSLVIFLSLLLLIIYFYPIKNEKYNHYLKNS